jgi:putative aldouronate transport system permease protein
MGRKKQGIVALVIRDRYLLLLFLPIFIYYLVFFYAPMPGILIAFKNYLPGSGLFGGTWVGLKWFEMFFQSHFFWRLLRNTFLLAFYPLLFGFPIPILFAICITEIRNMKLRRVAQTVSYLPYFISVVVVAGMLVNFLALSDGMVNGLIERLGGEKVNFMMNPKYFRTIYTVSGIWQTFGFNSIIYIAAILSIDPELYDSAKIDGVNKFQETWNITLPCIKSTIFILLILALGGILSVGFEKVYLLYNGATYETADVISTYVYRQGIESQNFGYATAVGLFNSAISFAVVYAANALSRRVNNMSLW